MLKFGRRLLSLVLVVGLLGSCGSKNKTNESTSTARNDGPSWSQRMQALSEVLSHVFPIMLNPESFNDPKNFERINKDVADLRRLAHKLNSETLPPTADPSLRMTADLFLEDLDRAEEALRTGQRDYARLVLRDTTAYCIQCHTQTNNGPDFPTLALNIDTSSLKAQERGEFFAATRQFDKAIEAFSEVIANKKIAEQTPFQWEKAVRSSLTIAVRVKKDAKTAEALAKDVAKNTKAPVFMREPVKGWLAGISAWKSEKTPRKEKPDAKLMKAEALVWSAQKKMKNPLDHSQDIQFFRASGLLHEWLGLQKIRNTENYAKALYLSGVAAEATRDLNFWTMHETYYEMCIKTLPHTPQAKQCYERLKESVYAGYTGSGGVMIPPEVKRRIDDLGLRAEVQ